VKYVVAAGVLVVGALIAVVAVLALRPGLSSSAAKPDALQVAAASLKHAHEISLTRASPAVSTEVSRMDARRIATTEARFLGGELEDAHLVYFTDPHYGKRRGSGPVIPFYEHRLAWLVLFRHGTEVMLFGTEGAPAQTGQVGVAAFVDAKTGAFITAITVDDLP
jgi:hypothetical protein